MLLLVLVWISVYDADNRWKIAKINGEEVLKQQQQWSSCIKFKSSVHFYYCLFHHFHGLTISFDRRPQKKKWMRYKKLSFQFCCLTSEFMCFWIWGTLIRHTHTSSDWSSFRLRLIDMSNTYPRIRFLSLQSHVRQMFQHIQHCNLAIPYYEQMLQKLLLLLCWRK